jgi:hypothetical protein
MGHSTKRMFEVLKRNKNRFALNDIYWHFTVPPRVINIKPNLSFTLN